MRSLSRADVLKKMYSNKKRSVFEKIINYKHFLIIEVDYEDYLRGKIFCHDMKENYGHELRIFNIETLLYLLYKDFIEQVRSGLNHKDVARYLATGKQKYFYEKEVEESLLKEVNSHSFRFERSTYMVAKGDSDKSASLHLSLKETDILRGEVLINDIEHLIGEYRLTVEEIIIILYMEFIELLKKEGSSIRLQNKILAMV